MTQTSSSDTFAGLASWETYVTLWQKSSFTPLALKCNSSEFKLQELLRRASKDQMALNNYGLQLQALLGMHVVRKVKH